VAAADPAYPRDALAPTTLRSKRIQILGILSVPSGMPLGFVFNTLQIFLRGAGVDLKTIGFVSSASVLWVLKFFWSPLLDRYALRWPGRRRSWLLISQLALALAFGALGVYAWRHLVAGAPGRLTLSAGAAIGIGAITVGIVFLSATQDIALDAYAVELLHPEEQGPASGLRVMYYRIGMLVASALALFAAEFVPWPWVFAGLGLTFVAFTGVTFAASEPERPAAPPRTLAAAVWEPLLSYFRRPSAVLLATFLVLYKFGDNLGGTMVNPFLTDLCFRKAEIALALKTIGTVATIGGAAAGAALMERLGLGRSLWLFGILQASGNLLYALAAATHPGPTDISLCTGASISAATRAASYLAIAGEYAFQGMGTAALVALVTRMCEKRYSATQYALLSSLFALGRWVGTPASGWIAQTLGYRTFFLAATAAAIPGLLVLQKIAPIQQKEVPAAEPQLG
jgi:PAT family beta-lactamase induction signal transducer AmpG